MRTSDVRRFPQVGLEILGVCNKNTKKRNKIEKSYLDHFCGPKNVLNRSSMLELLFLAPKNTFELLLSSEVGQFEVEKVDFIDFPLKILTFPFVPTVGIPMENQ